MLTIDRFEQDMAICFDSQGREQELHRSLLPEGAKEGDRLLAQGDGWALDKQYAEDKRQELRQRLQHLADGRERP